MLKEREIFGGVGTQVEPVRSSLFVRVQTIVSAIQTCGGGQVSGNEATCRTAAVATLLLTSGNGWRTLPALLTETRRVNALRSCGQSCAAAEK